MVRASMWHHHRDTHTHTHTHTRTHRAQARLCKAIHFLADLRDGLLQLASLFLHLSRRPGAAVIRVA